MAIPKKGSRGIQVDGAGYRWRVRRKPTYSQSIGESGMTLAIQHADEPGAVLVVNLPQNHPNSCATMVAIPVTPADVEGHIREALTAGWKPTAPGKSFEM
jgi:hypothetical protein